MFPYRPDLVMDWMLSGQSRLPPEVVVAMMRDHELLAIHDPRFRKLIKTVHLFGNRDQAELLRKEIRVRKLVAQAIPNPFIENLPPAGSMPQLKRGRIPLAKLPFKTVISVELGLSGSSRNLLICGPTGVGKSNLLRIISLAASGLAIQVILDRKGDLEGLAEMEQDGEVVVLDALDLHLALFQVLPGMSVAEFIALMTEMLARNLHLEASRRLISDLLYVLFTRKNDGEARVALSQLIDLVEKIRADALSRLGQYREAVLYALKDLLRRSGGILDHVSSNLLENVFSRPRTVIIKGGSIPVDHASLIVSLFVMYIFETRRKSRQTEPPVMFVLDDALPLVTGSMQRETEGGMNPIANWSFMGRALNIGLVVAAQNFSLVSPALRNNCDTLVCLGSSGEDAAAVARHMNLNKEQAAILPTLRPGEAIVLARSVWPLAVKGFIPEVR